MLFRQYFDHESYTYTYLIADPDSGEAALIDPVQDKTEFYLQQLGELKLTLAQVLDTHTHADHISANGLLRERTQCKTLLGVESQSTCVDRRFTHGDIIEVGALRITALHTPGHTDDSYSFHLNVQGQDYLFTGDTLLIRGSGRTDFQNGNAHEQYHSIKDILLSYPDTTLIYPGHDYQGRTVSTVAEERAHNPRLQVRDSNAYAELMAGLKLASPKMMDVAVPANQACGQSRV